MNIFSSYIGFIFKLAQKNFDMEPKPLKYEYLDPLALIGNID